MPSLHFVSHFQKGISCGGPTTPSGQTWQGGQGEGGHAGGHQPSRDQTPT